MSHVMTQMMNIKIDAFGAIQRLLPEDLNLQCSAGSTVADVLENVARAHPEAAILLERCACAIGEDIISRHTRLNQDSHLVLLSPVAGG
ncbi:MoaD/ThiS family protein [Acinetobacter pragensis]|uniref:Molybdopterin synthase sulfur carrier subunit n=1 Tax=Acinetobacter pragensis TaxID=1806892 RepID=A0A151Y2W5_9GAMM|nr:MoaD/ThiS family protein [Acinetobacter pragensis]KYQ72373.1 molybdopterin synthase sulfur carrier subunit [Acinetobacter pragensis]